MRSLTQTFLLAWWGVWGVAGGDNFAAVPGTGWTDITQLQSTCSSPGYYTNPSDCTRFYVCVDHSTAERSLLLRYDFDCPGGLAFDESTKNCNYPGPSGCVTGGSGWGWTKPAQGIWQSTSTVSRPPSWGTPSRQPGGTTIIRVPSSGASGPTIVRVPSTSSPVPSNPRVNIPTNTVIQVPPVTNWESQRLIPRPVNPGVFQSARVTASSSSESGGWEANRVVHNGVFQSSKVTQQGPAPSNPTVPWGAAQIIPVDTGVFESARVTAAPPVQWETSRPFPAVTGRRVKIVQQPGSGWSSIRISPSPSPAPANPSLQLQNIVVATQAPNTWQASRATSIATEQSLPVQNLSPEVPQQVAPITWQSSRLTQAPQSQPAVSWQSARITQVSQNPSVSWQSQRLTQSQQPVRVSWNGGQAANPSVSYTQSSSAPANPSYTQSHSNAANQASFQSIRQSYQHQQPANPTLNLPAGLENVRITQLPSGYIWQSVTNIKPSQPDTYVSSTPAPVANPTVQVQSTSSEVSGGEFGIVQQVINEQQGQSIGGGKSHIQLVYETKENQNQEQQILQQQQIVQQQQQQQQQQIIQQQQQQQIIQQQQQQQQQIAQQQQQIIQQQQQQQQQQIIQQQQQQQIVQSQHSQLNQATLVQSQQHSSQQVDQATLQQISNGEQGNAIYEFVAPPESGIKGRIIVLYAPGNNHGGKREAPVIEVEVEDGSDDESGDDDSKSSSDSDDKTQ